MITRSLKRFVMVVLVMLLASCASNGAQTNLDRHSAYATAKDVQIVATDLVSALLQLPGYDSWSMTVQVSPAPLSFGDAVTEALTNAGYGIQRVKQDQGQNYVSYKKSQSATDQGKFTTFEISVRQITVSRDYQYDKDRWIPISPLRIKGAQPTSIALFDGLHFQDGKTNEIVSGVEFVDEYGNPVHSTRRLVQVKEPGLSYGERIAESRFLIMVKAKLFTKQRAVDNSKIRNFAPVSKVTLTFPTQDPTLLGEGNKRAIAEMVSQMSPKTDGFIIRGCSHGKSLLWDGTESDSLERQIRVNQELLVSGVDLEIIRELSCFPKDNDETLPPQSVILTLRREVKLL